MRNTNNDTYRGSTIIVPPVRLSIWRRIFNEWRTGLFRYALLAIWMEVVMFLTAILIK